MLVFWQQSLVYMAIPKTGTTALEETFSSQADLVLRNPPEVKHAHAYRFRTFLKPFLDRAGPPKAWQIVTVVRDPMDWLSSWWRYQSAEHHRDHPRSCIGVPYADWIEEVLSNAPPLRAQVGSQTFFVADRGKMITDRIFAYEHLDDCASWLAAVVGGTARLPRRNVSPRERVALSDELQQRVSAHFAEDMRLHSAALASGARGWTP